MPDRAADRLRSPATDETVRAARDPAAAREPTDDAAVLAGRWRPGLTGHAGYDRRVLRSLQRRAGNVATRSVAGPGAARPALQRQARPFVQRDGPTEAETKKLLEDEDRAWNAARGKVGAAALFVWHEDPTVAKTLHGKEPETSILTVAGIVDRNSGEPKRKSFDSAGAAAGLASVHGPAIVFKQDRFFFVATLSGGEMVRDHVYKVDGRMAVEVAVGNDSLRYPLNTVLLLPSQDYAAKFQDSSRAEPTDAAGMRSIAGVKSDEDIAVETVAAEQAKAEGKTPPDPRHPERTKIPPEKQEAFIANYFRARAMELLGNNLRQAQKLKKDFQPGNAPGDTGGVSPNAKALIESTKEQGGRMREILEKEALAQRYLDLVSQRRSFRGSAWEITVKGKTTYIALAQDDLKNQIDSVKEKKNELLAHYPMLALMVDSERKAPEELSLPEKAGYGAKGAARSVGENVEMLWKSELEKPTLYGRNQYDASSFGKGASDEELRKEFYEKVVGVETAVREAMAKVLGEGQYFLYGMAPLRTMVLSDLAGNPELKAKAEEILKSHDTWSLFWNILGAAVEFGLLFVPGVGPLLSAVAGLATSGVQLELSMQDWNYSKAAIDPTQALVDRQEAEDNLFWDTVFMAAAAADFGAEVAGSLAKGGKALTEEEKAAKEIGARPYETAKRQKAIREAEEQAVKHPTDVPPKVLEGKGIPSEVLRPAKPAVAPLSDDMKVLLEGLGIKVSEKGAVAAIDPSSVLMRANRSWAKVKSILLTGGTTPADKAMGEYLMATMVGYRKRVVYAILERTIDKYRGAGEAVGTFEDTFEAVGSTSLRSDLDFTVRGPHASEIVRDFNAKFRQWITDAESAVAFDTNVFTRPAFLDAPIDVHVGRGGPRFSRPLDPVHDRALIAQQEGIWKQFSDKLRRGTVAPDGSARAANVEVILAEAEKLYPLDFQKRMAHVNNFTQETASHMKAADTYLAQGKAGTAEWEAYKADIIAKTPPDSRAHQVAVLKEAEQRVLGYQDDVLIEINKGRAPDKQITRDQLASMASGSGTDHEMYIAARNRLYEERLGKVSAESKKYAEVRKQYEELHEIWQSGKATPEQEAKLLQLQQEVQAHAVGVGASQSEALYFGPEGYMSQGAFLYVVQNGQKAKNVFESPAYGSILASQARDACYELLGNVIAHSGGTVDDALAAAKSLDRANLAYLAHPLAKGGGGPGILGFAGQVLVAKGKDDWQAVEKLLTGRYGTPMQAASAAFSRDLRAAGAQLRGQMARISGQPVKLVEESWVEAVASGRAKTLLMYATLAASKTGAVDRATH